MKGHRDEADARDPVLCIEYLELNVLPRMRDLIDRVDARNGAATSSRKLLQFLVDNIKVIASAVLMRQLDSEWQERAEGVIANVATLVDDLRRVCKKLDPEIEMAVKAVQAAGAKKEASNP